MIRIIIKEVKDSRVRTTKAAAVCDIEIIDQLGFADLKGCRSYGVSIRHNPPDQDRVRWQTTLQGFDPRNVTHWHLVRDALAAVLPRVTPNENTFGASTSDAPAAEPRLPARTQ